MNNRILFFIVFATMVPLQAVVKQDAEVFGKWIIWQKVFKDRPITSKVKRMNASFWKQFLQNYSCSYDALQPACPFLADLSAHGVDGICTQAILPGKGKKMLSKLYTWLDHDVASFIGYLKKHHFIDHAVNRDEQNADINSVLDKYKALMMLLLSNPNSFIAQEHLFGVANRFFEYCFQPRTFPLFYDQLNMPRMYQINRLLYSILWYHLVGEGWKHWHRSCLEALAKQAAQGKEIVYIAGGNDIYRLLEYGIYNIRIVDPMLPSQPEYYAEGWDWLIRSTAGQDGIGDRLVMRFAGRTLVLVRSTYQENGIFSAQLSTAETVNLPLSTTTWDVIDKRTNKRLGHVIFERRFCCQRDFTPDPAKVLLMSCNEMYFIAAKSPQSTWGIDVQAFDPTMVIYIKQLRKPVGKEILVNVQKSDEGKFAFVLLGSCPS